MRQKGDIPFNATLQLLRHGLEQGYGRNERSLTDNDLLRWANNRTSLEDIMYHTTWYADQHCGADLCKKLGWEGNLDLAGRGVGSSNLASAQCVYE
jgi:hypothetical protein